MVVACGTRITIPVEVLRQALNDYDAAEAIDDAVETGETV